MPAKPQMRHFSLSNRRNNLVCHEVTMAIPTEADTSITGSLKCAGEAIAWVSVYYNESFYKASAWWQE